jgi:transposase InsO family protein
MQLQGKLTVERMCQLAGVSRAGFYRHLVEVEPDEEAMELHDAIQRIYLEHRRHYGYRRITAELRHRGMLVNRKRVARLMREDNLIAVGQRKFVVTTDSKHNFRVYLNLAARMEVTAVNQLWVADITYIRLLRDFVFLAVILDAYSRRALGRCLARSLHSELSLTVLRQASASRQPQPGLVHHSDRGVQYASREYTNLLEAHGMLPSMSRPGNPWDNASCESFMSTLKREEIYCRDYPDYDDLQQHLEVFIDHYYNRQRLHSALGYRTPADFEAATAIAVAGESSALSAVTAAPRMSFFQP